jgi:hypothetical protein
MNGPSILRRAFPLWSLRVLLLCAWWPLTGCINLIRSPEIPRQQFSLALQVPEQKSPASAPVLAVRLFDAAPMFENQGFVYKVSRLRWQTDFYHTFAQPPAVLLTYETRRWMVHSGLFRSVAIPGLAPADSWQLQGFVNQMYGDFQDPEVPRAVLSVRYSLLPPGAQASTQPLFSKTYEQRRPLGEASPAGLVEAWNRAAEGILRELTTDIQAARKAYRTPLPPPPPDPAAPRLLEDLETQ